MQLNTSIKEDISNQSQQNLVGQSAYGGIEKRRQMMQIESNDHTRSLYKKDEPSDQPEEDLSYMENNSYYSSGRDDQNIPTSKKLNYSKSTKIPRPVMDRPEIRKSTALNFQDIQPTAQFIHFQRKENETSILDKYMSKTSTNKNLNANQSLGTKKADIQNGQENKKKEGGLNSPTNYGNSNNNIGAMKNKRQTIKGLNNVWKKNAVIILSLVVKFIAFLKNVSVAHRFTLLNKVKLDIIGDQCYDYDYYRFNHYMKKDQPKNYQIFWRNIKKFTQKIFPIKTMDKNGNPIKFVFQPDGYFKIIWEIIIFVCIFGTIIYFPVIVAFNEYTFLDDIYFKFLGEFLPQTVFVTDIIFKFNTAYYEKGTLIQKRIKIIKNYAEGQFTFDFILSLFYFVQLGDNMQMLSLIQILRMKKMFINLDHISDLLNLRQSKKALFDLLKLIIIIIFTGHICGCIFLMIAHSGDDNKQTWLQNENLRDIKSWQDEYIAAFYYSVITMNTVGFGDIYPVDTNERLITIGITIFSCGVFAYSVNEIGNIFNLIKYQNGKFKEDKATLVNHMQYKGVNRDLQNRVKKFYEYIHQENLDDKEKGDQLMQKLPESLKNEIQFECNLKLLKEQKLLTYNFSENFIRSIAEIATEDRLGPEHVIFSEGKQVEKLYFLKNGNIELSKKVGKRQVFIRSLSSEDNVGILWFFNNQVSSLTAKTQNVVTILSITKDQFNDALKQYQVDFEIFSMMKDNVIYYKSNRQIFESCNICDFSDHNDIYQCQFINFVPNKYQIYNKVIQEEFIVQERDLFERKSMKPGNYKSFFHVVKDACVFYMFQNFPGFDYRDVTKMKTMERYMSKQISHYSQSHSTNNLNVQFNFQGSNNESGIINRNELFLKRKSNSAEEFDDDDSSSYNLHSKSKRSMSVPQKNQTHTISVIPNNQGNNNSFIQNPSSVITPQNQTQSILSNKILNEPDAKKITGIFNQPVSPNQGQNSNEIPSTNQKINRRQSYRFSTHNISPSFQEQFIYQKELAKQEENLILELEQQGQVINSFEENNNYLRKKSRQLTLNQDKSIKESDAISNYSQSQQQRRLSKKFSLKNQMSMSQYSYYSNNSDPATPSYSHTNLNMTGNGYGLYPQLQNQNTLNHYYDNDYIQDIQEVDEYNTDSSYMNFNNNQQDYTTYKSFGNQSTNPNKTISKKYTTMGTFVSSKNTKSLNGDVQYTVKLIPFIVLSEQDKLQVHMIQNLMSDTNILGFEQMKNFETYFVRGNYEVVVKCLNQQNQNNLQQKQQQQKSSYYQQNQGSKYQMMSKISQQTRKMTSKSIHSKYKNTMMDKMQSSVVNNTPNNQYVVDNNTLPSQDDEVVIKQIQSGLQNQKLSQFSQSNLTHSPDRTQDQPIVKGILVENKVSKFSNI